MGHLSKEQFAALLYERYRIESNLRNSHIDEVHTLEQGFFLFSSKPFVHFATHFVSGISVVHRYEVDLDSFGYFGILLFRRLP